MDLWGGFAGLEASEQQQTLRERSRRRCKV